MHRAVVLLGLLLAAFGALLGALGNAPVAAASIAIAGALLVVAGFLLRRRGRVDEPPVVERVEPDVRPVVRPDVQPVVRPDVQPVVRPDVQPVVAPDKPSEALGLWPAEASQAIATAPTPDEAQGAPVPAPEPETLERQAIREAELAREAELNAIADELRALRSRDLSSIHIPEWKARIETWVDVDLKARAERGEDVSQQAAEWMRDFGEIPVKDWRRHLLRHLRRLGYRNYREGEW